MLTIAGILLQLVHKGVDIKKHLERGWHPKKLVRLKDMDELYYIWKNKGRIISDILFIVYLGKYHGFSLEFLICSTTCISLARQVKTAAALCLAPELNNSLGIPLS